jgi:dTDP-4-amino-4,6-dideoxygalactose transaminase
MNTYKRRLSFSQIFKRGDYDLFQYLPPVKDFFMTESVRGGLEAIIDKLVTNSREEVLMPVFIAEGVVRPFRNKRVNVIFYRLSESLNPVISDIEQQLVANSNIKFLVVVHYFGFAYDFAQIRKLCTDKKIILLEDCVHGLFSKNSKGVYLGMNGDISFFSLPKILPVPDGAVFFVNNPELIKLKTEISFKKSALGNIAVFFHLFYLIYKKLEIKLPYSIIYRILNLLSKSVYGLYYNLLNISRKPKSISRLTLRILGNLNYEELISARQENIKSVYEVLSLNSNIKIFKKYEPLSVLTGVPLISRQASMIMNGLYRHNIECLTYKKRWCFIPRGRESDFKTETDFFNNHFLLPVHEDNSDYCNDLRSFSVESGFLVHNAGEK